MEGFGNIPEATPQMRNAMNMYRSSSASQISTEKFQQEAEEGGLFPEMDEAMAGSIQRERAQLYQHSQFLREFTRTVENVVLEKAVPLMIEAARSQFDQALSALAPVVAQEVVMKLGQIQSSRSLPPHAESSESMSLALHFVLKLPDDEGPFFTLDRIQDHKDASVKVELQNSSGSRLEASLGSSAKIKLYVLNGEFDVEDRNDWTALDFDKNVARPRENKGPLLKGKCEAYMSNGVAEFCDVAFTDNSSPRFNGMFRFGARVVKGLPSGVSVRDAVSQAFKVRERRLKSYSKHKVPSLQNHTECLKHIGQALSQKLAVSYQVRTVKDFLQLYYTDSYALEKILSISSKKWSELIEVAKLCPLTDKGYCYDDEESGCVLFLDCVFNIIGVKFIDQAYQPYGNLDDSQKNLVDKIRHIAYKKRHELPNIGIPSDLTSFEAESLSAASILYSTTQHRCEGHNVATYQTDQGEQQLFHPPADNVDLETLLTSDTIEIQASFLQQQEFNSPPDTSFFEGAEACQRDRCTMPPVNEHSQCMVPNANAAQGNLCKSDFHSNGCKKPRTV